MCKCGVILIISLGVRVMDIIGQVDNRLITLWKYDVILTSCVKYLWEKKICKIKCYASWIFYADKIQNNIDLLRLILHDVFI